MFLLINLIRLSVQYLILNLFLTLFNVYFFLNNVFWLRLRIQYQNLFQSRVIIRFYRIIDFFFRLYVPNLIILISLIVVYLLFISFFALKIWLNFNDFHLIINTIRLRLLYFHWIFNLHHINLKCFFNYIYLVWLRHNHFRLHIKLTWLRVYYSIFQIKPI